MNGDAVRTQALTRHHGPKRALDALDLQVRAGGVHALVGANGAGKSTLLRLLLGFDTPDSGRAWVLGRDCGELSSADRACIGFVGEEPALPAAMQVQELITMQRRQYAQRWDAAALQATLRHFQVLPQQTTGRLSRGERAGLCLALALAQAPDLLILDEPTLGLDVVAQRAFVQALLAVGLDRECTVLLCSHQMAEVEALADELIVLERGRLRYQGEPEALAARVQQWQVEFPFRVPAMHGVPGLLSWRPLGAMTELLVMDAPEATLRQHLQGLGAARMAHGPVSLVRAIDGLLSQGHAGQEAGTDA